MPTKNLARANPEAPAPESSADGIRTRTDAATNAGASGAFEKHQMVSARQIATRLGVTDPFIYKLRRLRKMPTPFRIGTSTRWDADEIERWIETLREPVPSDEKGATDDANAKPVGAETDMKTKQSRPGPRRTSERKDNAIRRAKAAVQSR